MTTTSIIRRPRRLFRAIGNYALLTGIALLFIGPFLILLSNSLKSSAQSVVSNPPDLIPRPPVLDYFVAAWTTIPFPLYMLNSVLYVLMVVPLHLAVSATVAWALARYRFRGRSFYFALFLSTMFLPGELMLIPRFVTTAQMNLVDTYAGVALQSILGALGIFLLRQAFLQIPTEIYEAARIDGASEWRTFVRIGLPLVAPSMVVLGILGFISMWNSFIWPLVVLTDQSKYPLALGIAYLTGVSGSQVRPLAAGTVMSLIPVVVVFILLQRRIMSNMGGAVKG